VWTSTLVRLVGHGLRGAAGGKGTGGLIPGGGRPAAGGILDQAPPLTYSRTGSAENGTGLGRFVRGRRSTIKPSPLTYSRSRPFGTGHVMARSAGGPHAADRACARWVTQPLAAGRGSGRPALLLTYKPHGRPRNGTRPENLQKEHAQPCAHHAQTARKSCALADVLTGALTGEMPDGSFGTDPRCR